METLKPKETQIEEIRCNVSKIEDGLGMPIDEGIKDTVVYLQALDFPTSQSCEGHRTGEDGEESYRSPFVEVYPKVPEEDDWYDDEGLRNIVIARSEALKARAENLLEEYYKASPKEDANDKLTLWQIAYGWRFEPLGTEELSGLNEDKANILLQKQQEEMKKFTQYLEKRFYATR